MLKSVSFLALVLAALGLVPAGAHLFSLPNKIGMSEAHYYVAQSIYNGWALFGFVLVPGLAVNVALAFLMRRQEMALACAIGACVLALAILAIFFVFTYPANVATANWTTVPPDWQAWRRQWEYSHAVNAVLAFGVFCLLGLAVLARRS